MIKFIVIHFKVADMKAAPFVEREREMSESGSASGLGDESREGGAMPLTPEDLAPSE